MMLLLECSLLGINNYSLSPAMVSFLLCLSGNLILSFSLLYVILVLIIIGVSIAPKLHIPLLFLLMDLQRGLSSLFFGRR
jgi:hypothetical protein